jgi:hypothetical protein
MKKTKPVYCEDCGWPCDKSRKTPTGFQCKDCVEDGGVWVGTGDGSVWVRHQLLRRMR